MADRSLAERLKRLRDSEDEPEPASEREPGPDARDERDTALLQRLDDEAQKAAAKRRRRSLLAWFVGADDDDLEATGAVTDVPPIDDQRWKEQDFYPVEAPYTFARILRDKVTGELRYQVIEPSLNDDEKRILAFVEDALVRGLNIDPASLEMEARHDYLRDAIRIILRDYRIKLDELGQRRIDYFVRRDFLGYGEINVLMSDPNIEDISCDGAREDLFVFHRLYESIPTTVRFASDAELDGFVIRMAQRSGKAISISEPMLDAALTDGSRLQATLGREVTQNGSTFTIRRFRPEPFTPLDLVNFGTMDVPLLAWFWMMVENGRSLIFAGGTASGKTTALNAIGQFIPPQAKVVTIEDTREVNLPHKNWIKAVTRSGSLTEGAGEIGMFELLKAALRQRPEFILVGEVRGVEATVAFQAMATGHTVYSTMHADSARSVVYRLENDPINIPRLVLQALDIIAIQAQVRIKERRVRRVLEVVELVGLDPSTKELLTNTVFRWDPTRDRYVFAGRSFMMERLGEEQNMSPAEVRAEFERRQRVIQWMQRERIPSVQGLTDIVKAYYLDPEAVLERIQSDASSDDLTEARDTEHGSGERADEANVTAEGPGATAFLEALREIGAADGSGPRTLQRSKADPDATQVDGAERDRKAEESFQELLGALQSIDRIPQRSQGDLLAGLDRPVRRSSGIDSLDGILDEEE